MTAKEEDAAIWTAFYNKDTIPQETDLKDTIGKIQSLVLPCNHALDHAAAALITSYANDGCPTDCGPDWSQDHIKAAIKKGPHTSALDPAALEALHAETAEKVKNRYTQVICFGDIWESCQQNSRSPLWL